MFERITPDVGDAAAYRDVGQVGAVAETLAKAGLRLAATTVGRMLKARPPRKEPGDGGADLPSAARTRAIRADYPNHVWHVNLTVVPTSAGFWAAWFPFSLLQVWPFCWWVAAVEDHFSRRIVGYAVFRKQPTSLDVRSFIGRAIGRNKAKCRHIITDRGGQFDCKAFRKWCKRRNIRPRYGAVGKYGSIALMERFILSMKSEFTNRILIPLNMDGFRRELGWYMAWYNEHRPHQSLDGRTPQDLYSNARAQAPPAGAVPNSKLPKVELQVEHFNGSRQLPIIRLTKAA